MKGDFTRYTFDAEKHYFAVLDQQGRVRTDADKLEEVEIESHLRRTAHRDIVGQSGAPADNPGFQIGNRQGVLSIGPGHYYVDGILCENEAEVSFTEQPYLPGQILPSIQGNTRRFLAYLDVWRRHITAIEDPQIMELALGGPDTTTRLQTVWQVRLIEVDTDANCLGPLPQWEEAIAPPDGQLSARALPPEDSDNPCIVPPDARYTGFNALYRVEIRQVGGPGEATFVWDRDNGSDAFSIEEFIDGQPTDRIRVGSPGRSGLRTLNSGDIVEVTDDLLELAGEPGVPRSIEMEPTSGIVILNAPVDGLSLDAHPKVRRWGGGEEVTLEIDTFIPLEKGVQVRFEGTQFRSGDYWLIPARTATRDVEWPRDGVEPLPQPPLGIKHHYCRLGLLDFAEGDFEVVDDCRNLFPALSQPSLKIERIIIAANNLVLSHNGAIRPEILARGLDIQFNASLSEDMVSLLEDGGQSINPVIEVQLFLPEPATPDDREFWSVDSNEFFGFRAVTLASSLSFTNDQRSRLRWSPSPVTRVWLPRLFTHLIPPGENQPIVDRLLLTLRVLGNFVWADGPLGTRIFLDGETFANPHSRVGLNLPSGNGQIGGNFDTWCWIIHENVQAPLNLLVEPVRLNVVSGVVSSGGEPIEGATVRLRLNSGVGAGSEQTTETDNEGRFSFTALEGNYTVIAEALGATTEENLDVGPVIVLPPGGGGGPGGPGDLVTPTPGGGGGPGGPGDLVTPTPRGGGGGGPGILNVRAINGIGQARAALLVAEGVTRVAEFVNLPPSRVSEILRVSSNEANRLIANAREALQD